ncbi:restriction endonuclease subunit S, partial [Salinispora tropica]|uniref:restriction endonuclease subunit S n=1 Tax=Salinispora tropica TaxID=168695 RepID=UPI0005BA9E64
MPDFVTTFSNLVSEQMIEIGAGRPRTVSLNGHDLPVLRVADVLDGRIESAFRARTSHNDMHGDESKVSRPGDIVLTTKGTVGRVALMPADGSVFAYSPQLCYFRPTAGPLRSQFLYYWFKSSEFWIQAEALKGQTDMADFLSLGDIHLMRICIPPLERQDAVVGVLGALDDKIVANNRAINLAVDLADAHFAGSTACLPTRPLTFGEVADIGGGGTPRTTVVEHWDGNIEWATPTDVTRLCAPYLSETSRKISESGLASCSSKLYPIRSILMTSRATIGAFAIAQVPLAVNQGFIVVNALDKANQWWLFHEMRARVDEFISHANGATFLELPRGKFKKLPVRMPTPEGARVFASKVAPLHESAAQLMTEAARLKRARDELLPLLMSGRIRVRDAEKVVEEVV